MEPLEILFRGRVIAPTFHFEERELDFGPISFGFESVRNLTFCNSSKIPIKFRLRIAGAADIDLAPSSGLAMPGQRLAIRATVLSHTAKAYDTQLVVDIDGK